MGRFSYETLTATNSSNFAYKATAREAAGKLDAWPNGDSPRLNWTWSETVAYVDAPVCHEIFKHQHSSHNKAGSRREFNILDTWEDNLRAVAEGWREGLARVAPALAMARGLAKAVPIAREKLDVGGERPSIPHAVAGDPRSMWRRAPMTKRFRPTIRVRLNLGAPWFIDSQVLVNRGAAVLAWCDSLEAAGYSTEIETVFRTVVKPRSFEARVIVKEAGDKFDLDRLAYVLVCPDYMRRTHFAMLEACGELEDHVYGYGVTQNVPAEPGVASFPVVYTDEHYADTATAVESVRTVLAGTFSTLNLGA